MNIELKSFIDMLRRATHCGYPSVILHNRMFLQCYNLDIDAEIGLNYVLHIPDKALENTDFYDHTLEIKPREILKVYGEGHKELLEKRKEEKLPAKTSSETLEYEEHKHRLTLKFRFYLAGEEVITKEYDIPLGLSDNSPIVENCLKSYMDLMDRIKLGGSCLLFNGSRQDLQRRIVDYPGIYRYRIRYQGKRFTIPFTKSMFLGIKEVDQFFFSIQESTVENISVFALSLEKKGIVEQFWGYVLEFE